MLSQPKSYYLLGGRQTCVCVHARTCGNYFFSVCADGVIRVGWWVEGLSEVISPSHLIIGSLADSLDGSPARRATAAVNRAVNACRNRCQSPLRCYFYPTLGNLGL